MWPRYEEIQLAVDIRNQFCFSVSEGDEDADADSDAVCSSWQKPWRTCDVHITDKPNCKTYHYGGKCTAVVMVFNRFQ